MCGRFVLRSPADVLSEVFGVETEAEAELPPHYNIAPGQDVVVVRVRKDKPGRQLDLLRWGLVPYWTKETPRDAKLINARVETAPEKPAFRGPFRTRRCLIPADGFYEWSAEGRVKQPFLIRMRDGAPFAMAGLWDRWRAPDGSRLDSCTILTTEPNDLVRPLHDRMPLILPADEWERWLDPKVQDPSELESAFRSYPSEEMEVQAVSLRVNDPRNDDPSCLEPAAPSERPVKRPPEQLSFDLGVKRGGRESE